MAARTDAHRDWLTLEHRAVVVCTEHPVMKAQEMCTVEVNYTVLGPVSTGTAPKMFSLLILQSLYLWFCGADSRALVPVWQFEWSLLVAYRSTRTRPSLQLQVDVRASEGCSTSPRPIVAKLPAWCEHQY